MQHRGHQGSSPGTSGGSASSAGAPPNGDSPVKDNSLPGDDSNGTLPSWALPKAQTPVTAVLISSTIAGSLIPILTIVPNDPIKNSDNGAAAQAVVISSTNAAGSIVAVSTRFSPNVAGNSENGLQNVAPAASVVSRTNYAGAVVAVSTILPVQPGDSNGDVLQYTANAAASAVVMSSTNAAGSIIPVSTFVPPISIGGSALQNAAIAAGTPILIVSTNTAGSAIPISTIVPQSIGPAASSGPGAFGGAENGGESGFPVSNAALISLGFAGSRRTGLTPGPEASASSFGSDTATGIITAVSPSPTGGASPGSGPSSNSSSTFHPSNEGKGRSDLMSSWGLGKIANAMLVLAAIVIW